MRWSVKFSAGRILYDIKINFQNQSNEVTQIAYWSNKKLDVDRKGTDFYGERLKPDFTNNEVTLKLINAAYEDRGNYTLTVLSNPVPIQIKYYAVTVYVNGMFFCSFNFLIFYGSSLNANRAFEIKYRLHCAGYSSFDYRFS